MQKSEKKSKETSAAVSTVAGLLVGAVGKMILHPIDTIKAKIQVR
jgi:hypothetical protein